METVLGLVLVDTGFGLVDVRRPAQRLGSAFVALARPRLDPEETVVRQIERMGFSPTDIRHIALTHLDLDHAGGLADFPHAQVHVSDGERRRALDRRTPLDRVRYRPLQWTHAVQWVTHGDQGDPWLGFERVQALDERLPEVLLVPLPGHTRDHRGVAVALPDGWLLHCGDAYFVQGELDADAAKCPAGLTAYQKLMAADPRAWRASRARPRAVRRDRPGEIRFVCTHDAAQLNAIS